MKKRLQTLFIVSLTVFLLTVNVSAFSDVSKDAWYADDVNFMNEIGIMVGDANGNFNPDKPVTRAEMAVIICRTFEATRGENEYLPIYLVADNFSDVPATHWANGYINKASFLEIIQGYGDGRFGPSDNVTYEQAVTMMVRALGKDADATNLGGYPNGYLSVAEKAGLLSGMRATKGEKLSRANVAVLLSNYFPFYMSSYEHLIEGNEHLLEGNNINTPGNNIDQVGNNDATSDNQSGNSIEIGGSQQEAPPVSNPGSAGGGGGT